MLSGSADDFKVLALRDLSGDTVWGPFSGSIQSGETADGPASEVRVRGQRSRHEDICLRFLSHLCSIITLTL